MAEKKNSSNISIRGVASYPKTNRPYVWDNAARRSVPSNDPNDKPTYECSVIVTSAEKERVENILKSFAKEKRIKNPTFSIRPQYDEGDNETGMFIIKANQFGFDKEERLKKIAHFDGAAKPLSKDFALTSGSQIILSAYMTERQKPTPGVKLNINAIQVLNYVEPVGQNPFEAEDGAWVSTDAEDDTENTTTESDYAEEDEEETTDF